MNESEVLERNTLSSQKGRAPFICMLLIMNLASINGVPIPGGPSSAHGSCSWCMASQESKLDDGQITVNEPTDYIINLARRQKGAKRRGVGPLRAAAVFLP